MIKISSRNLGIFKNKSFIPRIEECIVNAKTDLSKRRLIRMAVAVTIIAASDMSINGSDGSFIELNGDLEI